MVHFTFDHEFVKRIEVERLHQFVWFGKVLNKFKSEILGFVTKLLNKKTSENTKYETNKLIR